MKFYVMSLILVIITLFSFHDSTLQSMNYSKILDLKSTEFQLAILDECFPSPTEVRVIIVNWTNYKERDFKESRMKAIILLGVEETDYFKLYQSTQERYTLYANEINLTTKPFPAKTVFFDELNINNFELTLYKLKSSDLWSIRAFYLIKTVQTVDSCKWAFSFFKLIWDFNILSVLLLCHDFKFGINLYTFNPYSRNSPKFWRIAETLRREDGQLLTLLVNARQTANTSSMCEEIWFDKTEDLSEYPVRVAYSNLTYQSMAVESSGRVVQVEAYRTGRLYMKIIWKKLKARLYTPVYFTEENFGEISNDGIASGIVGDVLEGKYEALGSEDYQRGLWKLEVNTFLRSGLCIIVKKVNVSLITQLMKAFPLTTQLGLLVMFVMISLLLSYVLEASYVAVVLDVFRTTIGVSMIEKPRVRFGGIIILWFAFAFMILNTYLQSQLSAMLVTASLYVNDEAELSDLLTLGYDVYFNRVLQEVYRESALEESSDRYFDSVLECIELLKTKEMVACIEDCTLIKYALQKTEELDILYDMDYDRNDVLIMRDESPLHDRVENIYGRMFQHGIVWYINDLDKMYYQISVAPNFEKLSMQRLKHSVYILLIGYAASIFVFFLEIARFHARYLCSNLK